MTSGFQQQQNPHGAFAAPRSAPTPQHGQKSDQACARPLPKRVIVPRPGH